MQFSESWASSPNTLTYTLTHPPYLERKRIKCITTKAGEVILKSLMFPAVSGTLARSIMQNCSVGGSSKQYSGPFGYLVKLLNQICQWFVEGWPIQPPKIPKWYSPSWKNVGVIFNAVWLGSLSQCPCLFWNLHALPFTNQPANFQKVKHLGSFFSPMLQASWSDLDQGSDYPPLSQGSWSRV